VQIQCALGQVSPKKVKFQLDSTADIFVTQLWLPRLSERLDSAMLLPGKIATPRIEPGSMAS